MAAHWDGQSKPTRARSCTTWAGRLPRVVSRGSFHPGGHSAPCVPLQPRPGAGERRLRPGGLREPRARPALQTRGAGARHGHGAGEGGGSEPQHGLQPRQAAGYGRAPAAGRAVGAGWTGGGSARCGMRVPAGGSSARRLSRLRELQKLAALREPLPPGPRPGCAPASGWGSAGPLPRVLPCPDPRDPCPVLILGTSARVPPCPRSCEPGGCQGGFCSSVSPARIESRCLAMQ